MPELKSTHTTRFYEGECPSCGQPAEYKISEFSGPYIGRDHSTLVTINCEHCDYHEFYTTGKDI